MITISLNQVEDIYDFVRICSSFPSDVDLISGRLTIDAKSIMGVLSLQPNRNLQTRILSTDEDEVTRFEENMARFKSF